MSPIVLGTVIAELLSLVYPVGSIFMTTNSDNPAAGFGFGHWVPWGEGRVPIGVYSKDADFNAAEKTGGAKASAITQAELPAVPPSFSAQTNDGRAERIPIGYGFVPSGQWGFNGDKGNLEGAALTTGRPLGNGVARSNMQPYITCYMWKRIA